MDLFDARFLIESERRREEIALAAQHMKVQEAQARWDENPPSSIPEKRKYQPYCNGAGPRPGLVRPPVCRLELPVTVSLCFLSF